ncbi:HI0074 family nucleotidyltransferase substrate-binding subunit [Desulfonatronum thioautotrophicum]|uniref:HI0074 family nucleotidyltransferase substrate-binding subunit n=1 Tax=Desulfonatronum thioautotrophicum TaxID=617001 RepID=UPI00069A4CA1|nr:HI0074 family nucleotidyltransferase substrate-binding subunit [Desulfonatronum thioautotrophicum]
MEQADILELKLRSLDQALRGLEMALQIDDAEFLGIQLETIQCGKIQKFEVCVELFWKAMKKFLQGIHGIEAVSPKTVIKQLYQTRYIDEPSYERLVAMINDRNRLSHVYDEIGFQEIYQRLSTYLNEMLLVVRKVR